MLLASADYGLPIAALIVSIFGVVLAGIFSARTLARAADAQRVENLEADIERLEKRITECETDRVRLHRELEDSREREYRLMQRVLRLEQNGGTT